MSAKHCQETNPELWAYFWEVHKDRENIRPRFFVTESSVNASLARYLREDEESAKEAETMRQIEAGSHPALISALQPLTFSPFASL